MKRTIIGFAAATFIPPLGAAQLLAGQGQLVDAHAWLGVFAILISSLTASAIYTLTMMNKDAGNPPLPAPVAAPIPVIASPVG